MNWLKRLFPNREETLDREIAFHLAAQIEANIARGMSRDEARRQALVDFGGREQVRQSMREVHVSAAIEALRFNIRSAARLMRRSPSFSLAVMLTLALGIGANSAVFSAMDAVVWRPLPFPGGDQLLKISQHDSQDRDANPFVAPVRLEEWNRMASTFDGISGYYLDDLSELSGPLPEKITEALVAPRFFAVLQTPPMLGRNFTTQEEHWGGPNAVILSYRYWQRKFHGDPTLPGKMVRIGNTSYAVVGVMPEGFQFPNRDVDLWSPSAPDAPFAQRRDATWFTVIGRMRPGVGPKQATTDLATVQSRLGKQFPKPDGELTIGTEPLKDTIVGSVRNSLWLLYGSVSLLLLIACSNIAALLLARTAEREREISVRFSLGASRRAVIAQLLTEVMALSLLGSIVGLLAAAGAVRGFHLLAETLPRAGEIALNWRVTAYSLGCAVLTAVLCGLFPALRGTAGEKRRALSSALASGSRTQASARNTGQWALVSIQVMLAVTLLVGAGLLVRSMEAMGRVSPGFDPDHVLTLQVSGSWGETSDMKSVIQRIDRTLDGLRSLPGVEAAATSVVLPGVPGKYQQEYKIDGKLDPGRRVLADSRWVSFGYFDVVRIPLMVGDGCRRSSGIKDLDVVVNRTFANLYLGGTAAVGHVLEMAAPGDFTIKGTVRGIASDAREQGLNEAPLPTVYSCYNAPNPFPNYLVRTRGEPMEVADAVRRRIHELEPGRSVYAMMPLQAHLDESYSENRLRTRLLSLFALTAVSLACVGLYGTLSYVGRMRQREVGVRIALGALRSQIAIRFLRQGLQAAALGCLAGVALALGFTRLLASMLFAVSPADPVTYAGVVVFILLLAAIASLVPALRAAHVEPVKVLREE